MEIEERLKRIEEKLGIVKERGEPVWFCDLGHKVIKFYRMTPKEQMDNIHLPTSIFDETGMPLIAIVE